MKTIIGLLFPALFLLSCRVPLLELNYQQLINKQIEQINSDEGMRLSKSCPHLYIVRYPYCDFYKESDKIIDYGLQFDTKTCVEKPEEYQLLSIINLHDGEHHDSVMSVLLISFVYPHSINTQTRRGKINKNFGTTKNKSNARQMQAESDQDIFALSPDQNDNILIKGSALVYSGKYTYTNKDSTELHLTQRSIYRQGSLKKKNLKLKTKGEVNLKLKLISEGHEVLLCRNIVNFSHNRLAGHKPVVFDIKETLGIEAIRFVERDRPCSRGSIINE